MNKLQAHSKELHSKDLYVFISSFEKKGGWYILYTTKKVRCTLYLPVPLYYKTTLIIKSILASRCHLPVTHTNSSAVLYTIHNQRKRLMEMRTKPQRKNKQNNDRQILTRSNKTHADSHNLAPKP